MSKNLKTVLVFTKIARILSKIVFIACIVGSVGCLIGIISLALGQHEVYRLGGISLYGIIQAQENVTPGTLYTLMISGMVICLGTVFTSRLSETCFRHVLEAGTPFTAEGSKELRRTGILTLIIPTVALIIVQIVYTVMNNSWHGDIADMHFDSYQYAGVGVAYIILSFLTAYGAELEGGKKADTLA